MSTITLSPRGPDTYSVQGSVFSVNSSTTVGALMADIQDQKDFPLNKQLLWQGSVKLTDRNAPLPSVTTLDIQDLNYYRIYFYRPTSSTREEKYVKGTDILSTFMSGVGMPSNQYTVTLNGVLIQGAPKYSNSLATNNIIEDSILRFNVDSSNG